MRTRKLAALMMALVLVLGMTACGNSGNGASASSAAPSSTASPATDTPAQNQQQSDNGTLFICPKSVGFDYWNAAEKGAMRAGQDFGYSVVFNGPSEVDSAKQINMVEDMLTQNITGLAMAPNDAMAVSQLFDRAIAQGVQTITFDTDAPDTSRAWYVGPDSDYNMGMQMADMIGEMMGGKGELAFMVASLGAENQVAKVEGAQAVLKEKYPDIEVVTTVVSDDDNQKALNNAQNLLQTYPDLEGILGFAGAEAPEAAEAVTQAIANGDLEPGKIKITGVGFPAQCRPYIKDGTLSSVLSWDPEVMGYVTVAVLASMVEGKPIDGSFTVEGIEGIKVEGQNVYSGCLVLDVNNIDQYHYA